MARFFQIIFFILLVFLFSTSFTEAQNLSLGFFSEQEISKKIPEELKLKAGDFSYTLNKNEIRNWLEEKEDLFPIGSNAAEIENINFCNYKNLIYCKLFLSEKEKNKIKKISLISINESSILKFIDDLARQIDKEPQDAKLQMEEGRVSVFSLSKNGMQLEKEKSIEKIKSYLKNNKNNESSEIELVYKEVKPEISIDSIDNLGITSLLGEGVSNFRGSPKNRIFNIKVATDRFNGILIKPGEEFSFTKILGEVDGEHGYREELVIKKDKTEPEFGGGICQVSTTAFRAAIYSGLEITARKNHAYPVQYYNPQGMDATVYVPRPDLRFINNTPGHILIQTQIEGTILTFRFYGTSDGRKTEVIGPKIIERKPDGGMKTTFTQKVYNQDGNVIREDIFNSNYDSPDKYPHPGQVLTQKPKDWSDKEWEQYKKDNKL